MKDKLLQFFLIFGLAMVLICCGGSGTSSSNDDSGDSLEATFSSIQENVFTNRCALSGCHSSASQSGGLSLAAGEAYGNLVSVASTEASTLNRVEPGDADSSYLINKLEGTQLDVGGSGVQMPKIGTLLTDAEIAIIAEWINNGAQNN